MTLPSFGNKIPERMRKNVVLPLPEGPTIESISPKQVTMLARLKATVLASPLPKYFTIVFARIASAGFTTVFTAESLARRAN